MTTVYTRLWGLLGLGYTYTCLWVVVCVRMYVSWVVYMLSRHAGICVVLMCVSECAGAHVPVASRPGFCCTAPGFTLRTPPPHTVSGADWDGEPRGVGEMLGSVPTQVGPANCRLCPLFMAPIWPQHCYP